MAETNDILEVAKMTISASIKCNTVRGFIGWHSCDNICMDMHDVLDMCEDAFKRERYQESLEADTYVLVSGVKLASCADSSSGMLTDVIMRAFELIDLSTQTIAKLDAAMRKHALSLIIKEAKKKAFDGWDSWRYELLEKAVCLCDEKLAAKLEKLLDIFLEDIENDYMPEYKRQEDTILRYKLAAYVILGINTEGKKEVLSITVGDNESSKYWLSVLNELKNRGVKDILIICADGLSGIKEAIAAAFPKTEYQRCIVHQVRNTLKYVPDKDRKAFAADLKTIYHASDEEKARLALDRVTEK